MGKLYEMDGMHRPLYPEDEEFFRHGKYYKQVLKENNQKVTYKMTIFKKDMIKNMDTFVSYLGTKGYNVLSKEDLDDRFVVTYEKEVVGDE